METWPFAFAGVSFATALFPKDGRYLLPLRAAVRTHADIDEGDVVAVALRLDRDATDV